MPSNFWIGLIVVLSMIFVAFGVVVIINQFNVASDVDTTAVELEGGLLPDGL